MWESVSDSGKAERQKGTILPCGLLNGNAALERGVVEVFVIVKPAPAGDVQVPSLPTLAGSEKPDLVDFWTVGVLGMRIGVHRVISGIAVHERHLRAARHCDVLRADRVVRDRNRGGCGARRAGARRWTGARARAAAGSEKRGDPTREYSTRGQLRRISHVLVS